MVDEKKKTKLIPIDAGAFDGVQFEAVTGLSALKGDFSIVHVDQEDGSLLSFVEVPDTTPDDIQTSFPERKSEPKKLAEAIVAENVHDDAEWAKLSDREALDRLRRVYLKAAALQLTGKADAAKIEGAAVAADAAALTASRVEVRP